MQVCLFCRLIYSGVFFADLYSDSGFQKINISKRMADEEKNGMSMGKEVEI